MKKKIAIGSFIAVFLLMIMPSVPAVEFNTSIEYNKSRVTEILKNMDIKESIENFKDTNTPFGPILQVFYAILLAIQEYGIFQVIYAVIMRTLGIIFAPLLWTIFPPGPKG